MGTNKNKNLRVVILGFILILFVMLLFISTPKSSYVNADNNDAIIISTQTDFDNLIDETYENLQSIFAKNIILLCDIDATHTGYPLIGNFNGKLYGNNHTIKNLNGPIFNNIKQNGLVRDLVIELSPQSVSQVLVKNTNEGVIENILAYGNTSAISFVSTNGGTIENCVFDVNASSQFVIADVNLDGSILNNLFKANILSIVFDVNIFVNQIGPNTIIQNNQILVNVDFDIVLPDPDPDDPPPEHNPTPDYNYHIFPINENLTPPTNSNMKDNGVIISLVDIDEYVTSFTNNIYFKTNDSKDVDLAYENLYIKLDNKIYDSFVYSGSVLNINEGNENSLNINTTNLYAFTGYYPISKGLFSENANSKLVINSLRDLIKLEAFVRFLETADTINCSIEENIKLNNSSISFDFYKAYNKSFLPLFSLTSDTKNIVYNLSSNETFFSANSNITIDTINLAVELEYGADYSDDTSKTTVVGENTYVGSGTKELPYLIKNINEFKHCLDNNNSAGVYIILVNDVFVNLPKKYNYSLNLKSVSFKANLIGGFNKIINTSEQLFSSIDGQIKNLEIIFTGVDTSDCVLANDINNLGIVQNIIFSPSANLVSPTKSVICENNYGLIENIENNIFAPVCIASLVNTGTINNCLDLAGCTKFNIDNNLTNGYAYKLNGYENDNITYSGKYINNNEIEYLEDLSKENVNASFLTYFGYGVKKSLKYPRLKSGFILREDLDTNVSSMQLNTILPTGYQEGLFDTVLDDVVNQAVYLYVDNSVINSFTTKWEFNGVETEKVNIDELGTYSLTITITSDYYFDYLYNSTITIGKGNFGTNLVVNDFKAVTVTYTGSKITPSGIDPSENNNIQDFLDAGFSIEYSSDYILNVGTYSQSFTLVSPLYISPSKRTRTITVSKKNVTIAIGNITTTYKTPFEYGRSNITVSGLVGSDIGKDFVTLCEESNVENLTSFYTTSYTINSNVGSYALGFNYANLTLKNYLITGYTSANNATITVNKAPINEEDIVVYLDNEVFNNLPFYYNGEDRTISLSFLNNELIVSNAINNVNINAGSYTAEFNITSTNYTDFTKYVDYEITKNNLAITVTNDMYDYGTRTKLQIYNNFTYSASGFVGNDNINLLNSIDFEYQIEDIEIDNSYLLSGVYNVTITTNGELDNYNLSFNQGTLTINKISLTTVYRNNNDSNKDFADLTVAYDGEVKTRSITFFDTNKYVISYVYKNSNDEIITNLDVVNVGSYTIEGTVTPIEQIDEFRMYNQTTYICNVVITKIQTSISYMLDKFEYTFDYDEFDNVIDFLDKQYVQYVSTNISDDSLINMSAKLVISQNNYQNVTEIKNAGLYRVTLSYEGDENHFSTSSSIDFKVNPQLVNLDLVTNYEYSGSAISVEINSIVIGDTFNGKLTLEEVNDPTFTYLNGLSISQIISVNSYYATFTLNNPNYLLETNKYMVTITQKNEILSDFTDFEFIYGSEEITINGYEASILNKVITVNINVDNISTQVRFTLKSSFYTTNYSHYIIGDYIVDNDCIINDTGNYKFTLENPINVQVNPKKLDIYWTVNNVARVSNSTVNLAYKGSSYNDVIVPLVGGLVNQEDESTIDLQKTYVNNLGPVSDVKNVALYLVTVNKVGGNINYYLDSTANRININIVKYAINVKVKDATVRSGETLIADFELFGSPKLQGEDDGKSIRFLEGFEFDMQTDYNPNSSAAGSQYSIGGTLSFLNYDVYEFRTGTVSVIEAYKTYSMTSSSFVYDGNEKSIYVNEEVEPGVNITYQGNGVSEVGNYTITALIRYPTGRNAIVNATLTINKATPVINTDETIIIYKDNLVVDSKFIKANASLNNEIIDGNYKFTNSEEKIVKGTREYQITFTPQDTRNIEQVEFVIIISSYEITDEILLLTGDYEMENGEDDDTYYIKINKGSVTIKLSTESLPIEISKYLVLQRNNVTGNSFSFNTSIKNVIMSVYFNTEEVLRRVFNFTVYQQESSDDKDETIDYNILKVTGIKNENSNAVLTLSKNGGTIALPSEYKDSYALYIDNVLVEGTYQLSVDKKQINVQIRDKRFNDVLFEGTYTIEQEKAPEEIKEDEGGFKTWYWYIIGGVAGALVFAAFIILVVRRR